MISITTRLKHSDWVLLVFSGFIKMHFGRLEWTKNLIKIGTVRFDISNLQVCTWFTRYTEHIIIYLYCFIYIRRKKKWLFVMMDRKRGKGKKRHLQTNCLMKQTCIGQTRFVCSSQRFFAHSLFSLDWVKRNEGIYWSSKGDIIIIISYICHSVP